MGAALQERIGSVGSQVLGLLIEGQWQGSWEVDIITQNAEVLCFWVFFNELFIFDSPDRNNPNR